MVDWSSLNTVFLDMDGTLLDLHFDNHFWLEHLPARYAEHYDLHPQEAKDRLIPMIMAERGMPCTHNTGSPKQVITWVRRAREGLPRRLRDTGASECHRHV